MEKKYEFGNAFQPSEKDKLKNEELRKKYKFRTWVPESVTPVGDSYVFYNDLEDLKGAPIGLSGLYEHCKIYAESKLTDINKSHETLEYFNNNIINKLTIHEYLSELNYDMLDMLEEFITEERERRIRAELEDGEDLDELWVE